MVTAVAARSAPDTQRYRITVHGQVQGVGFRPFVFRLANRLGLRGWIRNCGAGVEIESQGPTPVLQEFLNRLQSDVPPRARVAAVHYSIVPASTLLPSFIIAASRGDTMRTEIAPDAAVCPDCLRELFDPGDRRYRYPFIACVDCGPRFTLARSLPFDRHNISMAEFVQCPVCGRECESPDDRRFHSQTNACPSCGPRLSFHDGMGNLLAEPDIVTAAVAALQDGRIVALKGLGGFHLLCDARNHEAVTRLRERKGRESKPFAVMAANVESLLPWTRCSEKQRDLLESAARPIVLLEKAAGCDAKLAGVAPQLAHLGAMLPYTPLHYLLFHEAAGRPSGTAWLGQAQELLMVCTSANIGGEPLVIGDREAFDRLYGIADCFVTHDREITQRCDDSVLHVVDGAPLFIRRARGFVPQAIKLPYAGPSLLALGGDLKNTFCVTRGDQAYVSQHNGDLDSGAACRAVEETLDRWLTTLDIAPECVVHDRHPDFFSSRLARCFAAERQLPCMAVQHHHAHIAAVLAERGITGPVLGIALDGFGLGDDDGIWGGELLRVEGEQWRRLGHLQQLALPGGDRAAREPWRMAASSLHALGRGDEITRRFPFSAAETVREMLDKRVNAPLTSSAGRWFDAAAGILGTAPRSGYEGQAAMELEALALRHGPVAVSRDDYDIESKDILNLLPLFDRLAGEQDAAYGAALFHSTLAAALSEWIQHAAARESLREVVLNGGCFMNGVLCRSLVAELRAVGLNVHVAQQVPPNDGGLSLGQAWVGLSMLTAEGNG